VASVHVRMIRRGHRAALLISEGSVLRLPFDARFDAGYALAGGVRGNTGGSRAQHSVDGDGVRAVQQGGRGAQP
jgi:hypothetical protein